MFNKWFRENAKKDGVAFLAESAGTGVMQRLQGRRYKARLISAGQGATAFYSESVLREYGPSAFPKGTKIHLNHAPAEKWDEVRGVEDIIGVIDSEPVFENDGLYAEVQLTKRGDDLVGELIDYVGLSIFTEGKKDANGNAVSLFNNELTSVDVVSVPGANGQFMQIIENYGKLTKENQPHEKDMDMAEIDKLAESLEATNTALSNLATLIEGNSAKIDGLLTAFTEKLTPAEPAAEAVDETKLAVEAATAGVPAEGITRIIESVKSGVDAQEAIQKEVTYLESYSKDSGEGFHDADDAGEFDLKELLKGI